MTHPHVQVVSYDVPTAEPDEEEIPRQMHRVHQRGVVVDEDLTAGLKRKQHLSISGAKKLYAHIPLVNDHNPSDNSSKGR